MYPQRTYMPIDASRDLIQAPTNRFILDAFSTHQARDEFWTSRTDCMPLLHAEADLELLDSILTTHAAPIHNIFSLILFGGNGENDISLTGISSV